MKKLVHSFGIDRAVFFTLLGRGWNVGAGLIIIALVAHFLSPELQGYYYTFNSLIALQVFAELGLNFAIIQFASHEMAQLSWQPDGTVSGNPEAKRRLQSLLHFALTWFAVAALLMILLLLPTGLHFFGAAKWNVIILPNVAIPWSLLVVFVAFNLFIGAAAAILEGCGKVAKVAALRLCQSIFAMTAVCVTLSLDGQLYALALSSLLMAVIGFAWLWFNFRAFFKDLFCHQTALLGMSWRKEIWPFQWRIAVSWMSGYLIFQLFNPLIFKTHGPVAAGQMGMSLQIIAAMNGTAMAWITTKAPTYGQLVATQQTKALDALFRRGLLQSFVFLLVGVLSVWSALFYLNESASTYAARILPLPLFSWLCLVCLANHIVFAEAAYLRAHKEEPFMWLSIFGGLTTAVLALLLVPPLGKAGAVYSYLIPALVFGLLGGTTVFFWKRKAWASNRLIDNILVVK